MDMAPGIIVERVVQLPPGSAMNATMNEGLIPYNNGSHPNVNWTVECVDESCHNQVLIMTPDQTNITLVQGTEISLQIMYNSTYNYYG